MQEPQGLAYICLVEAKLQQSLQALASHLVLVNKELYSRQCLGFDLGLYRRRVFFADRPARTFAHFAYSVDKRLWKGACTTEGYSAPFQLSRERFLDQKVAAFGSQRFSRDVLLAHARWYLPDSCIEAMS